MPTISPTTMPFGKHKGVPLEELDHDYVTWLLKQDYLKPDLRANLSLLANPAIRSETKASVPDALKGHIRSIVLEGYRVGLARLAGDPIKLKALQAAREHLETILGL